jgi:outer membrane beta-barrel protein
MRHRIIIVPVLLSLMLLSSVAAAQRKNPLDEQPAVRRRLLYLPGRFEVAPSMGMTFLQDFKHAVLFGMKAEYHIPWCFGAKHFKECLSVGASVHASAPALAWDTELTREIKSTLGTEFDRPEINPAPTKKAMDDAVSHVMLLAVAPYIAYTPWLGKMSLLGQVFFNFDFYVMAGLGMAYFQAGDIEKYSSELQLDVKEENGGMRFGPAFGFGARFYILKWLAIQFDFRDIYLSRKLGQGRNSAGFDKNGSLNDMGQIVIDENDRVSEHVMYFTVGASFFFPLNAPRSD